MSENAATSLSTGLEDTEKVTVALLMAVGAAESGRPTVVFAAEEAVRLTLTGVAVATACEGCPPLAGLVDRFRAAGGQWFVCPICFNAKGLDAEDLIPGATLGGTVQLWEWIGDEGATTFSY